MADINFESYIKSGLYECPEEAINFIENEIQIDVRFCSDEEVSKTKEVLEFAISALEKRIPKKLKFEKYRGKTLVYCPTCDALVCEIQNIGQGFCSDCGQRLDWSDLL